MIQKIKFNDCVAIRGMGRVDETRPIDLREYVIPKSKTLRARRCQLCLSRKRFVYQIKLARPFMM